MDTNYLAEIRLRRLDSDLHSRYTRFISQADTLLGRYRSTFPEYTDHSLLHSMTVTNFCNALIGGHIGKLNADELYILLMSALLHDSGMGMDQEEFDRYAARLPLEEYRREHPDAALPEIIRGFHNDLSAFFVEEHYQDFGIPDGEYACAIAKVSRGHRCADLMDRTAYPARVRLPSGRKIHLPYLAAVLRLADGMDISASRNLLLQYAGFIPDDDRSAMEFQKHRSIHTAAIEGRSLVIRASTDDPQEYEELCRLCKSVQKTMEYCRFVAYDNLRVSLPVDKVCSDIVFTGHKAPLIIQVDRDGETLTLKLKGRVDTLTSPLLEQKLAGSLGEGIKVLAIELGGVDYISSAGLRVLLGAKKKMNQRQGELRLTGASAELRDIFRMTGFDVILKIEPS